MTRSVPIAALLVALALALGGVLLGITFVTNLAMLRLQGKGFEA